MEDQAETMNRVGVILQMLRKKNTEIITQRSKKQSGIKETWKDSFETNADELCPICGGQGYIIKHTANAQDTIMFCKCREMDKVKRM